MGDYEKLKNIKKQRNIKEKRSCGSLEKFPKCYLSLYR